MPDVLRGSGKQDGFAGNSGRTHVQESLRGDNKDAFAGCCKFGGYAFTNVVDTTTDDRYDRAVLKQAPYQLLIDGNRSDGIDRNVFHAFFSGNGQCRSGFF